MDFIVGILTECWEIFVEASPYVLFGFFAAGILKALIPEEAVARHLGESSFTSVLKASLLGVPLPLCSCGVIPAAVSLRKQGASKGASAAFLVSTPESGVDSIAITYALLDPVMTVVRPVSALLTAIAAGVLINRLPEERLEADQGPVPEAACGCPSDCGEEARPTGTTLGKRMGEGLAYAFGELLKDIGKWLLVGIAVAGTIAYLVPDDFFARYLSSEFLSLLIMLVVGIPLYICASASTPIAAALVLKGISPGAALVFLLAGPATNAATVTVIGRFWGRRATTVYLATIALCSLLFGYLVNRLYDWADIDITGWVQETHAAAESPFFLVSAVVLILLLGRNFLPRRSGSGCGCDDDPGG